VLCHVDASSAQETEEETLAAGMIDPVLALPRVTKGAIVLALDAGLCVLTVWLAFYLRVGEFVSLSGSGWPAAIAAPLLALPIFAVCGLYRTVFRYVGPEALGSIAQAVSVYGILYAAIFTAFGVTGVPRTVGMIQPALLLIAVSASRVFARYLLSGGRRRRQALAHDHTVLIYGAGSAGQQLAKALEEGGTARLAGFIDDSPDIHGSIVSGKRVWRPEQLASLVDRFDISEVLLAIPSASRSRRNEILGIIRAAGAAVRTLPGLLDIVHNKVTVSDLRPLEIEDLLSRETVAPDASLIDRNIADRVVLVTGAGGSIGSELCRQILAARPSRLLLVENCEFNLYSIHKELAAAAEADPQLTTIEIVPFLASVCDPQRIRSIFSVYRPQTVYHAAAYKHVPLVEQNVIEGVRNNVFGTENCARIAREHGTRDFVLVSTDKAVRPTNVMGATKRLAELVLQAYADSTESTCYSMVRFGNVLGSSGSVVPLFRAQIAAGGPVTVTHRDVTRYFMTIPEAAQLVIQAGSMARGGEVFVLDMGEPVKIADLAKRMIELSGLRLRTPDQPDGDIEIVFAGLRPGEKLYEELLIGDNPSATSHPRVMQAHEEKFTFDELQKLLEPLRKAVQQQEPEAARAELAGLVRGYVPDANMADWLYTENRRHPAVATLVVDQGQPTSSALR
jgi:FlaA1/EpsC-like NDP-sugar epimerase